MSGLSEGEIASRVIVALDVDTFDEAIALVDRVGARASFYKVGSRLFAACGPQILAELGRLGKRVFLDLKYHDIPSVVEQAVEQVGRLYPAVELLTVHALGGQEMIRRASSSGERAGIAVIAVTALTSMRPSELAWLGLDARFGEDVAAYALALARGALSAGAAGIVCSAAELESLREALGELGQGACYVTPGIRPQRWDGQAVSDDQARVATPKAALMAGSSYLVVGRPVYADEAPEQAFKRIVESCL